MSTQPSIQHSTKKILVLGAGNFGTCLAAHLARRGHQVALWARDPQIVKEIQRTRKNPKYLSDITLPPTLTAINTFDFEIPPVIIFAVATQALRSVLELLAPRLTGDHLFIGAMKGLDNATQAFPMQLFKKSLGEDKKIVFLSGPSFASDIALQLPTALVAASFDAKAAEEVQEIFHTPFFRVYTSDDPIGLEIAGALKNVIAIGVGCCAGLGFQDNARAALMTRGLGEIMRIGVKLGAKPLTFLGLGGVGDLFLTCSSEKSRNFKLGKLLGEGLSISEALKQVGSVSEGYFTAQPAYELSKKLRVEAPILREVFEVLYNNKPVNQAVIDLTQRSAKEEFEKDYE